MVRKHVGTEILTGNAEFGASLEGRPPLSVDQRFTVQPVRDELLARLPALLRREGPKFRCETGLAPCGSNSSLKSGNVRFLHVAQFTRNLVRVNKEPRLTDEKGPCTVLYMPTAKKKPAKPPGGQARPTRRVEPVVGPDGFTMSQRVSQLMAEQGMSQSDLARACSSYYHAFMPSEPERVKQQHIFNIIQGQDSSWVVPLIAAVFDVDVMWLQFGIGKREHSKH